MSFEPNTNLLHYRFIEQIGEGGMGVVWKAVDTTLDREVAIKILPEQFATDPERLARFQREAKLLASLNHPNIAAVYGLHEAEGVRFLAMELVDGEDLSKRLNRGPLPVEEALDAGGQICSALEAAHGAGVIHRDLKPANVIINNEGQVKVLDFGLAKALDPSTAGQSADPSLSPTMTSAGTVAGMILGTASYMSPEQARGKPVDRRADIWSFGAVLYEMLCGSKAFAGETITDMIASVVKEDPDWSRLPADLSPGVVRTMQRCLAKKRRERFRDIGDVHWELEHLDELDRQDTALPIAGMFRSPWALITAVLALLLVGALMGRLFGSGPDGEADAGPKQTVHVEIVLPDDAPVAIGSFLPAMAFIPDESGIVYVGLKDGTRRLYVRKLDDPVAVELPGTEGAEGPFVSPDSQWIGFYAEFALRKVPVAGGTPAVITTVRDFRGAAWGPGGRVVFADGQAANLKQVKSGGGEITNLTEFQDAEWSHRFPSFLPGGDAVLYCAQAGLDFHYEKGKLRAYSIADDSYVTLDGTGCDAAYAEPGRLLYIQGGDLIAVPFDLEKLAITGPPETVIDDVAIQINTGASQFAVSPAGNIAFAHGSALGDAVEVTRIDRQGNRSRITGLEGVYRTPRLSPDGRQLLLSGIGENNTGIWKLEVATGVHRRMVLDADRYAWDPNGDGLVYATGDQIPGDQELVRTAADFSGVPESILKLPELKLTDAGRDGRFALTIDGNIYTLPDGGSELEPFLETEATETGLRFSPDGRFVTYVSDETGRYEVYVAEFPGPGGKWQISNDGGRQPVWSRDGNEIFFRSRRRMLAVPVRTSPSFEAGGQQELFLGPYEGVLGQQGVPNYDVAADRQSFIMLSSPELQESQARVGLLLRR